jgi:hypothetical protein
VWSGASWTEQQKLVASDGAAGDHFGFSVALSGDTALIGANQDDSRRGAAYVFVRSGTTWTEQQKLVASNRSENDGFGASVAISGDTALVGASGDNSGAFLGGSAHVFVRSGATWTEQQELVASDSSTGDAFGTTVSLSGDTALFGVG